MGDEEKQIRMNKQKSPVNLRPCLISSRQKREIVGNVTGTKALQFNVYNFSQPMLFKEDLCVRACAA